MGRVVGGTVLALETDGLVNNQVAADRVCSSKDCEANDNAYGKSTRRQRQTQTW